VKIGLLGGSFDPPHNGHLALAETALKGLELEKILFLPSGNHPIKKNKTVLSANQRFNLIEKAIADFPLFEASRLDMNEERPSYSAELIKRVRGIFTDSELYFITGDDIVQELPKWHNWQWLLKNVQFVVAQRPDTNRSKFDKLDYLEHFIFIKMPPHDISSTEIRKRIKAKQDISDLVPNCIKSDLITLYS